MKYIIQIILLIVTFKGVSQVSSSFIKVNFHVPFDFNKNIGETQVKLNGKEIMNDTLSYWRDLCYKQNISKSNIYLVKVKVKYPVDVRNRHSYKIARRYKLIYCNPNKYPLFIYIMFDLDKEGRNLSGYGKCYKHNICIHYFQYIDG